jgi:uncharacterized protein (TIGR00299 family) protein
MRVLVIEPFGGIAGDMLLAGLLDLERPEFAVEDLRALAGELVPGEVELGTEPVVRRGLRALRLDVRTPETGAAPHRHLSDLLALLDRCSLPPAGRARAAAVLRRIAEAEARVHGIGVEEVHFHEVGAVDTLVDVAGAVLALERLQVERVVASAPYLGGGTVECAHGTLPVPAPATAELLLGLPQVRGEGGERTTPTGAALLAELADVVGAGGGDALRTLALGLGAGTRDPESGPANALRVSLAESGAASGATTAVWRLEFNLDDTTGEEIGYCVAALREAGALEVWTVPVQMKKDRPGAIVTALARDDAERRAALEAVAFTHSPTLGVRWSRLARTECAREERVVELAGHAVRVKRRVVPGRMRDDEPGPLDLSPEYDDLARVARETGRPLRELEQRAVALARSAWRGV